MFSLIKKLLNVPMDKEEGDFKSYLNRVDNGSFKDKMCYGISDDKRGFLTVDPVENPGALYCGGMGSGKSIAMRFTVLTHFITNSQNTIYILVDTIKGMTDYRPLFDYRDNVAVAINDPAKLVAVIEMLTAEMHSRKDAFSKIGANHIYKYEAMMKKHDPAHTGLARIVLCVEEFHTITTSDIIKYSQNVEKPGTAAFLLKEMLKVGRSYGITMLAATQRATSDDFPNSLKPGITQTMAFRVNTPTDASAINLSHASDIRMDQRGRCAYESGYIQFPYIDDEVAVQLLKKYNKPLKAKLLKYQMNDYHTAFEGEGNEGMVQIKTFKSLFDTWQQFNADDIVSRLLRYFEFDVVKQRNQGYNIQLIATRDNIKYGVYIIKQTTGNTSDKVMTSVSESAKILNCEELIVIHLPAGIQVPQPVVKAVSAFGPRNGLTLDFEDLAKIANIVDHKSKLEEEGSFEQMYNSLSIAKRFKDEPIQKKQEEVKDTKKEDEAFEMFSNFEKLLSLPGREDEIPKKQVTIPKSLEDLLKESSISDDLKKKD
jgi:hypothetical protein